MEVNDDGTLIVSTMYGTFQEHIPLIYQGDKTNKIFGRYSFKDDISRLEIIKDR